MVLCGDWNKNLLKKNLPNNVVIKQIMRTQRFAKIKRIDDLIDNIYDRCLKKNFLKKNGVDILFCPFSAPTFKEEGIPTVSVVLDIQHEFYPQFFDAQELKHRRAFYQNIVNNVESVVCISDFTKKTFCAKYNYPIERAKTIYIAIQNRFYERDDTILERLDIIKNNYIVYPANFWEHKNHKLLIIAFSMYLKTNYERDFKLVLTGNPLQEETYYKNLLIGMGLEKNVIITGYISNEQLYSILFYSCGLIYPSLFEGFGIPIIEAMNLNKLIACSNLTSLPEIGCPSIFYFNPKKPDDILKGISFLANNEIDDNIKNEYKRTLKKYDTDKMIDEYIAVFKKTISTNFYINNERLTGVYSDGWSSSKIYLCLRNREHCTLKLNMQWPPFLKKRNRIVFHFNMRKLVKHVKPGEWIEINEYIDQPIVEVVINIARVWLPNIIMNSTDTRRLGVRMVDMLLISKESCLDLKKWLIDE